MKKRNKVLSKVKEKSATKSKVIVQNKLNFVPKVSVIIPVYNVSEYLPQCLDSVLNQTLKEIEVICVNDGSTDNSLEILKDYAAKDKRITVVSRENMGVGYSRNEGINLSKGEFISFMDPDDYYPENDTLEKMYNGAKKHKVKIAGGSLIVFDDNRKVEIKKHEPLESFKEDAVMAYKDFQYDYGFQRYIYDSSMIKGNKIYFPNYRRFQDPVFMIRAFECAGKFYAMTDYTYGYRWAHKDINWTEEKVYHLLCGLRDDLAFSADKYLWDLYERTLNRIKKEYKKVLLLHASERIKSLNKEVMDLCLKVASERYKNQKLNAKVSVVLPIYNAEPYLRECLDSVVNQTLKNIEIICVNDGSTDNSLDIIKEYAEKDDRVRYIDKPNAGYGQTMNCGMDMATGEYIGIVEPDDYIELDAYDVLYKNAKKNNTDFVKADIYFWWSKKNTRKYSNIITDKSLYNKVHTDLSQMGLIVGAIANCAGIYNREFLKKNNIRYQETPGASFQDQGFYYQVMMYAKSGLFLNVPIYHYRQDNSNSSINTPDKVVCIFNEYAFVKKKLDLLPNKKSFLQLFYTKMINSYLWNLSNASAGVYPLFRKKISEDFKHAVEVGELSKDLVGEVLWKKVEPFIGDSFVIPIILSSDDNYAPFMYVTMLSMLKNALPGTFYDFYLMVPSAFSDKNSEYILSLKDKYDCEIHFIDMKNQFSDLKMQIAHITSPTYYRLLAGDLLPREYDKCIYLDVDICVRKDLSELFDTDMDGYYIAGVPAAGYYFNEASNCDRLNLPDMRHYVNAGVLVMNLKKIREDNLTSKFVELSKKNYSSQDQDVINVACYGRIKIIPFKYNAIPLRLQSKDSRLKDLFSDEELAEAKDDPVIIHYADKVKPWNSLSIYMGIYWWKYGSIAQKKFHFLNYADLLKAWFKKRTGKSLNLDSPRTFNEKIQWLKLYDSTPIKTRLADKFLVRDWVAEKIGEQYLIPLLGVYDRFEDIDFSKLPDRFVIKCNHGCGYNIIVKDKSELDLNDVKTKLNKWLSENFAFKAGFELHYRDIPPKILIEQYMEDESGNLRDYKISCFNGKPEFIWIDSDRFSEHKRNLYDLNWNQLSCKINSKYDTFASPEKPKCLSEMLELAKILSHDFQYVRVDFYLINEKIYFGEMTFTSSSGLEDISPKQFDIFIAKKIKLPKYAYDIDTGKYYKLRVRSKLNAYLAFPWYFVRLILARKKYKKELANNVLKHLQTFRVDIKNFGEAKNSVDVVASHANVSKPAWFENTEGQGVVVEGSANEQHIKVTAIAKGTLRFYFKAPDRRFKGERFPVYVKYTSIKVDGTELLAYPLSAWHDKPFIFAMPVKNGQVVNVIIKQKPHKYETSELESVIAKFFPDYDAKSLRITIRKYFSSFRDLRIKKTYLNTIPDIESDLFMSIGVACRPAHWLKCFGLRQVSLPFDWMKDYNLNLLMMSFRHELTNLFYDYEEGIATSRIHKNVKDVFSDMISLYHFPLGIEVKDYLPTFRNVFIKRQKRMVNLLSTKSNICFLANRTDSVYAFLQFSEFVLKMFPNIRKMVILNINNKEKHEKVKYSIGKNIEIINIFDNDIHERGNNVGTNPIAWVGNEELWKGACSKLHLNIQRSVAIQLVAEDIVDKVNSLQKNVQNLAKSKDVVEMAADIKNLLKGGEETLQNVASFVVQNFSENISVLSNRFQQNVKSLESEIKKLVSMQDELKNLTKSLVSEQADEIVKFMTASVADLTASLNVMKSDVLNNTDANQKSVNDLMQNLGADVAKLSTALTVLDSVLQDNLNQTRDDLKNATQNTLSHIDDLHDKLDGAVKNLPNEIAGKQQYIAKLNSEPYWANVYHDTIINSTWLKDKTVSPGRWAVSYIVLYVLYRVLNEMRPANILECGLGQSSKLTVQYAQANNANLTICENNPDWVKFFEKNFHGAENYVHLLDVKMIELVSPYQSRTYDGFQDVIHGKKYDCVLIDGPLGSERYSRPEILDIVDNLAPSFAIMLDDMNRIGEQDTWKLLKDMLSQKGIAFRERIYSSDKSFGLICSPDLQFLTSL